MQVGFPSLTKLILKKISNWICVSSEMYDMITLLFFHLTTKAVAVHVHVGMYICVYVCMCRCITNENLRYCFCARYFCAFIIPFSTFRHLFWRELPNVADLKCRYSYAYINLWVRLAKEHGTVKFLKTTKDDWAALYQGSVCYLCLILIYSFIQLPTVVELPTDKKHKNW